MKFNFVWNKEKPKKDRKEYQKNYYQRVTKPKRKQKRNNLEQKG